MRRGDGPVRAATASDVDAIPAIGVAAGERFRSIDDPRIARRADDPPYTVDEVVRFVDAGDALVAEVDGTVAGFMVMEVLDGAAHVEELSVHPDHQGTGLGTALLDAAAGWAAGRGLATVTLTTYRDVPWNRPFYERRGFAVLTDAELTVGMRAKVAHEADVGLDPDLRVVMRRLL
ncbi:MAG: GNAT family N-acetyltransferase [Acidimicrobiia bacterium]|nr:GNAT family N-acetyltransferase [Acidimicrobiia bacterium]